MSQPVAKPLYQCDRCGRKLNSKSGKTNHQKKCKSISDYSATIEDSALTLTEKDLTSVAATDQPAPTSKEGDSRNITDMVTAATSKEIPIQNHVPIWGSLSQDDLQQIVEAAYNEVVHWRNPSGAAGKRFVNEMVKVIDFFNNGSEFFKDISLKLLMIMPSLLLQKPSYKSKVKIHAECLARRLNSWERGDWVVERGKDYSKENERKSTSQQPYKESPTKIHTTSAKGTNHSCDKTPK